MSVQIAVNAFQVSSSLIGTYCEADDNWYGKYRGIIRGPHKSYGEPRVKVEIVQCLRPPSSMPECCQQGNNPYNICVHREKYKPGEIHPFYAKDIIPLVEEG